MFDRTGREAIGRLGTGSRGRSKAGRWLQIEPLEGRGLMTASISPIAGISVPQFQGYQVPVLAGTSHAQTFTVTSDNPGVKASMAQGNFWSITVSHTSSGTGDIDVNGTMVFQLFQDLTPNTVQQIESLITGTATNLASGVNIGSNFYVGKNFHRIANGFPGPTDYIVQGGSLNGNGTGNVFARPFPDEFVQQLAFTGNGQIAMANAGSDTNDSQFFITTGSPTSLNYNHTIFGQIVSGQDILQQLTQVAKGADGTTPVSPVTITADSLSATNPNGVIHIDTGLAPLNAKANITVTATDVTDGTTATQTFPVSVTALASPQRPFISAYDQTINIAQNQSLQFSLSSVKTPPTDTVTYTVQGGTTTSGTTTTFTPVQNATASVTANGLVTVTPTTGYTGPITLLVGVRDQVNRSGTGTLDSPSNYKTHTITVNVGSSTTPLPVRPLTQQALVTASTLGATPISLFGMNVNATTTKPLTYAITTQPTHGVLTGFDPTTGTLNYTPAPGYLGPDAIAYTVTDPNSGLTSFATPISINVVQASTGAVRFFANDGSNSTTVPGVLVVTPVPRTDGGTNSVNVTQSGGNVQVTVNGILDAIQPAVTNVDSITVFGSKANDRIFIDPSVTIPATLNGGTDGKNLLKAGGGPTTEMGWYGKNRMVQGSSQNFQFGQVGHVTFVKGSGTSDIIFSGTPTKFRGNSSNRREPIPTMGTFFVFKQGKLVKTSNPYASMNAATKAQKSSHKK
ncbi:peptidylprolyl isomerase [Tundrisphaera lichenicola]|uniref:peptidylprolyl isomerase n=1 Tax=Tundrisphaera lichenicola TaxID=2029860 RepID=UPI003EBD0EBA